MVTVRSAKDVQGLGRPHSCPGQRTVTTDGVLTS